MRKILLGFVQSKPLVSMRSSIEGYVRERVRLVLVTKILLAFV